MFCSQVLAIIVISSTATVVITVKETFEREEISDVDQIQKNTVGQLMAIGRTVWGPKVTTLKGTEVSLSYVQSFFILYLLQ